MIKKTVSFKTKSGKTITIMPLDGYIGLTVDESVISLREEEAEELSIELDNAIAQAFYKENENYEVEEEEDEEPYIGDEKAQQIIDALGDMMCSILPRLGIHGEVKVEFTPMKA